MAREKKPVHKVVMTDGKRSIIHQLLEEYDIQSTEDIQDALKDLLGGTIKEMMEAEMDEHLGYEKSERSDNEDCRNGYKSKRVNSRYGSMEIEVPQDRRSTFEPQVVKKHPNLSMQRNPELFPVNISLPAFFWHLPFYNFHKKFLDNKKRTNTDVYGDKVL